MGGYMKYVVFTGILLVVCTLFSQNTNIPGSHVSNVTSIIGEVNSSSSAVAQWATAGLSSGPRNLPLPSARIEIPTDINNVFHYFIAPNGDVDSTVVFCYPNDDGDNAPFFNALMANLRNSDHSPISGITWNTLVSYEKGERK
jgi:hypothetical protein